MIKIMKNQTGLAPILIILLLAAATFGFLIYSGKINLPQKQTPQDSITRVTPSPSSDETTSWKTYTNTKYGYEIKYPKDIKISEQNTFDNPNTAVKYHLVQLTSCLNLNNIDCQTSGNYLQIETIENPTINNIDDLERDRLNSCYLKDSRSKIARIKIAGSDALLFEYPTDNKVAKEACKDQLHEYFTSYTKTITIFKDGKEIVIYLWTFSLLTTDPLLDQILATFKSIN